VEKVGSFLSCKRRANVTTSLASYLGVIFEPEKESFFELAPKRLPDMGCRASFETGNPPRNGATCNARTDQYHRQPIRSSASAPPKSGLQILLTVSQSVTCERDLQLSEAVYQIRSGFPRFWATGAHSSGQVLTFLPK